MECTRFPHKNIRSRKINLDRKNREQPFIFLLNNIKISQRGIHISFVANMIPPLKSIQG